MKKKTETELIADLTESLRLDAEIATEDQQKVRDEQEQTIKRILGRDHSGKLHVHEAMNGIFGRTLDKTEFEKYYPIYVLGFQTGQSLIYAKMLRSLSWLQHLIKTA